MWRMPQLSVVRNSGAHKGETARRGGETSPADTWCLGIVEAGGLVQEHDCAVTRAKFSLTEVFLQRSLRRVRHC